MIPNKVFLNEKEILQSTNLCDTRGRLNANSIGWSRNPIFNCNLARNWPRKKRWNYWCITSSECLFSITISNIDYAGLIFAYFLDINTKKFIEKTIVIPFGVGCKIPEGVNEDVVFNDKRMQVSFTKGDGCVNIKVACEDFGGIPMKADLKVLYPNNYETLNVVIPWSDKQFQFTSKHEGMPVEGDLKVGDYSYNFSYGNGFGCLDFGRGVWPYKVKWNWATISGMFDGRLIGINLGAQWTDGTGMTENAYVIDGRITKLSENTVFEYDHEDFMKPWLIRTEISDRVNLVFTPLYERIANMHVLLLKSEVHQMIGYFSGEIITDDGEIIVIDKYIGGAEDHFGQW